MTAAHSADDVAAPIQRLLQRGVDARVFPGAVWAAGDASGQQVGGALGLLDPADPSAPMTGGTLFDMASLTKIVAVWAGIGTLWENRQLTLDDPLAALMPGLADYPLGPVTVRQLLTHTAGVPDRPSSTPTGLPSSWDSSSSTAPVPGSTRWHASTSGNLSA